MVTDPATQTGCHQSSGTTGRRTPNWSLRAPSPSGVLSSAAVSRAIRWQARHLTADVAGKRVGILHGDPESLAGWRLALEAMQPGDPVVRHHVGWHGQPTTIDGLRGDALPIRFDLAWWRRRFLAQWPPGSPAHRSYFTRITGGTHLQLQQAARDGVQLTTHSEQL